MSSNNQVVRLRRKSGATLVEVLVAVLLSTILAAVVMTSVIYSARSYASLVNYIDLDQKSRNALDRMVMEIREATEVVSFATDKIVVQMPDYQVTFVYDDGDRTLTRVQGTNEKILLTECDALQFSMFQRNPVSGQLAEFLEATDKKLCKIIQVNWVCSRQILGRTWNTESVQTAKIVMRNQHL